MKYVEHIYWCVSFSSLRRLFMLFGLDSGISRKDEKESDEEEKNEKRKDDSEERKPERQEEPTP